MAVDGLRERCPRFREHITHMEELLMLDVIRAWKDPVYRASLSHGERSRLPEHPAGLVELTDEELMKASGLSGAALTTCRCCTGTSRPMHCCP